jgi:hypothetical protein
MKGSDWVLMFLLFITSYIAIMAAILKAIKEGISNFM